MTACADTGRPLRIVAALLLAAMLAALLIPAAQPAAPFDFKRQLSGPPITLSLFLEQVDASTGVVVLNGGDSRQPSTPFTFDWGDGTSDEGWFARTHTYEDTGRSYPVRVTAHYPDGSSDTVSVVVWFAAPSVRPLELPDRYRVTIPAADVDLESRMPGYGFSGSLTAFDDSFFGTIPRPTVEYVLSAAASLQARMANEDLCDVDGGFRQVLLRDPDAGGMYSIWYSAPVAFGVGDCGFSGPLQWSSFLHEMGHNATLNFPAGYHYGGKIDGNANAIFSETMAQVFQHAAIYELLNAPAAMGMSEPLREDIANSGRQSISLLRRFHDDYVAAGKPYASWNDPVTPGDETLGTFGTLGFLFCKHAEDAGKGYMLPCRRLMRLLCLFDEGMRDRYDQAHDTPEASAFRASLFAAGLSWAFDADLRGELRALNFPVDDNVYEELVRRTAWHDALRILEIAAGMDAAPEEEIAALDAAPSPEGVPSLDLADAVLLIRRAWGLETG